MNTREVLEALIVAKAIIDKDTDLTDEDYKSRDGWHDAWKKSEAINAGLLKASKALLTTYDWYKIKMYPDSDIAKAIRKAEEN